MSVRYYFSWFNDGLPNNIVTQLKNDITEKSSLVMISGNPEEHLFESDLLIKKWFSDADIIFDNYHIINNSCSKEDAKALIDQASVIFLCGGYPKKQSLFLTELSEAIISYQGIIMGASAGSMNMSSKWLSSINTDQPEEKSSIVKGIGLDNFFFCTKANQSITDQALLNELSLLLKDTPIYIAIGESAIRVKDKNLNFSGEIYAFSNNQVTKMKSSF